VGGHAANDAGRLVGPLCRLWGRLRSRDPLSDELICLMSALDHAESLLWGDRVVEQIPDGYRPAWSIWSGREGDGDVRRTNGSIACPREPGRVRESRGAAQRGVGGCWCAWFHRGRGREEAHGRRQSRLEERLVAEGRARAALVVEAYPQDTAGRQITASFLYNATPSLFEEAGFSYPRPKERTLRYDRHGRAGRALKGI
jgi:hypothetical protein